MDLTNREYKSDVFSMLLEDPENAFDVYKALGGSSNDKSKIEIKTLEKGISLSIRNDAAYIIDYDLHLCEHQSTYNPNMPLRSLFYIADIIKQTVRNRDLFTRKLIEIPKPRFVVFYNGGEDRPEVEIQKLSTAYKHAGDDKDSIELICTVYNINPNKNQELKEKSYVLNGYMIFVEKVREYASDEAISREAVVKMAVDYCIDNNILADFFRKREKEVIKSMAIDMTFETREKLFRREEREEGREEGRVECRKDLMAAFDLFDNGFDTAEKLMSKGVEKADAEFVVKILTR